MGVDSLECTLLDASGQRRGEAVALALGGGGAIGGARGSGGDGVDHERVVFAGGPGCLGASVEALSFLVCLEAVPFKFTNCAERRGTRKERRPCICIHIHTQIPLIDG